jgi:hypothetical protein
MTASKGFGTEVGGRPRSFLLQQLAPPFPDSLTGLTWVWEVDRKVTRRRQLPEDQQSEQREWIVASLLASWPTPEVLSASKGFGTEVGGRPRSFLLQQLAPPFPDSLSIAK